MRTLVSSVALACLAALAATPARAQNVDELLKKHACLSCHAVDRELIGPSYKEVAAKYRGQKDAQKTLVEQVKKGSVGKWPNLKAKGVPMPGNPGVPDADAQAMVKYILSLK